MTLTSLTLANFRTQAMKITRSQLKTLIKEEMLLKEGFMDGIKGFFSNDETEKEIPTSALMQTALSYNEISSLSDLIHLKPEHDALIMLLNDKSRSIKPSMGNIVALSLAITNLKVNNSEAAERFLTKLTQKM